MNGNANWFRHELNNYGQTCFQFVKRMNGNFKTLASVYKLTTGLASNSWSVWMETTGLMPLLTPPPRTCFQFVKRMNGNMVWSLVCNSLRREACFQFVKRMNGNFPALAMMTVMNQSCFQFVKRMNGNSVSFGSGRVARPCFQFVKRMNGNCNWSSASCKSCSWKSCFQFVKRMNGNFCEVIEWLKVIVDSCFQFVKRMNGNNV